jgi:hypothetical protein
MKRRRVGQKVLLAVHTSKQIVPLCRTRLEIKDNTYTCGESFAEFVESVIARYFGVAWPECPWKFRYNGEQTKP